MQIVQKNGLVMSRTNYVTYAGMNRNGDETERWKTFGRWMQHKREAANLTQEELAASVGLHVKTISRIENGDPSKRVTIERIAQQLGVDKVEALEQAGLIAPRPQQKKPQNPLEFVELLRDAGFEIQFDADLSHLGPDDLQDLLDDINAKLLFKTTKLH